jgi:hypothetical protein
VTSIGSGNLGLRANAVVVFALGADTWSTSDSAHESRITLNKFRIGHEVSGVDTVTSNASPWGTDASQVSRHD